MNWISWFGLGIVLLLLIPNAVYAAANKNTQPPTVTPAKAASSAWLNRQAAMDACF